MKEALKKLSDKDPVMNELAAKYGDTVKTGNYMVSAGLLFRDLAQSITGQQLSIKAASTIWGRVESLLNGRVEPEKILAVADEDFRRAGLSNQKTKYIKSLAETVLSGKLKLEELQDMPDEEVIIQLTKVKGIGRWTAEMFLIFALGRPDVFSLGDLGLKNAIERLYGGEMSKERLDEIIKSWAPHRSLAALLLWASLDNAPK